jgi:spore coat polysaccharide biosynthesis predicted glycosyltransferase SpsG
MKSKAVLIRGIQRNIAFQDDLLRKLAGKTLVQRAINKARELGVGDIAVCVYTDSELVALSSDRAGVRTYLDPNLAKEDETAVSAFFKFIQKWSRGFDWIIHLSPYAPLLGIEALQETLTRVEAEDADIGNSGRLVADHKTSMDALDLMSQCFQTPEEKICVNADVFTVIRSSLLGVTAPRQLKVITVLLGENEFEVRSHRDWWVCEKLLARKRIIVRVIGTETVGMGHIYRTLSLAHEITDHEIIFVTDTDNGVAVDELNKYEYELKVYQPDRVIQEISFLKPDMVINDILNTGWEDVGPLQQQGVQVVNFEDLGKGARIADITFNELYDEPQYAEENTFWGHDYFFVRDEFNDAKPCEFKSEVTGILLAFGGVDQHDLTRKVLFSILELCIARRIPIYIVTGPGYARFDRLVEETKGLEGVSITHDTGVISKIMERVGLAITSNGRTVYEMAHMNIPAIVIPQHERERTHAFACQENGFIPLTPYTEGITEEDVKTALRGLLDSVSDREQLYNRTLRFRFDRNKRRIIDLIEDRLDRRQRVMNGTTEAEPTGPRAR